MPLDLAPGLVVDALSGLLFLGLGAFVASRRPRRAANVLFAAFTAGWGGLLLLVNVVMMTPFHLEVRQATFAIGTPLGVVAAVALCALALRVPRPLARHERWLAAPAAIAGAAQFWAIGWPYLVDPVGMSAMLGEPAEVALFSAATSLAWSATIAASAAFATLLALRFRRPDATPVERRQAALVGAGLLLYPAMATTTYFPFEGHMRAPVVVGILLMLALTALWLRNTRGEDGHLARNVALLIPAAMLVGALLLSAGSADAVRNSGLYGLCRGAGVVLLAYAILRHQLFDLDVKLRWTIRQSTLAAIFVGVFFVVSEGAAALFSEFTQSSYLGIAAAGALVFALAPLQRAAERVASVAVPTVADPRSGAPVGAEAAYRTAVEMALMDRVLTRDEERALARLASQLGIDPERAFEIRDEAEGALAARG